MGNPNRTLNYASLEGSTVGRYRLQNLLGFGAMGNVYKSHHPDLNRDIAVKILHPHFTQTPGFVERFRHEAAAAGALAHPHIIQVYDFDVSDGRLYYMVMQYINGPSLEDYLVLENQPLSLKKSYEILAPVAVALHFAHEQGIVHRDVKPGNILLDTRQTPFLGDFGLAKIVGVDLQTAAELGPGTPAYMAPEQIDKGELLRTADIYALGLVLYKMLTLRLPYEGHNLLKIIRRKTEEPVRPPTEFNPNLPEEVESVILKAAALKPEDRYADAITFIEAYRAAIKPYTAALPGFDLDTALSSGFVPRPGIHIEGYRVQREYREPKTRLYRRYLAKNEAMQTLAVLTVLKATESENPILAKLFHERVDKLTLIDHPNFFAITRMGLTEDQRPFCAYEFVPGQTLAEWLAERGTIEDPALTVPDLLSIFKQIAEAIDAATAVRLYHQELTPQHLIIKADQTPILVGWEIPISPPVSELGLEADKPGYAAPEQLAGEGVSISTSLFAMGVMLYEALSGSRPVMPDWRSKSYTPRDVPEAKCNFRPDGFLANETQTLLSRCLATNPHDRFNSLAEFRQQLEQAITAERQVQVSLAPRSVSGRWLTWRRRLPAVIMVFLLLFCLGLYSMRSNLALGPFLTNTPSPNPTTPPTTAAPETTVSLPVHSTLPPTPGMTSTSPAFPMITVLGPAPGSQFSLGEAVTFTWQWPRPLADEEQFVVYFLGGQDPIRVGAVRQPANSAGTRYQVTVSAQEIIDEPLTYAWQVQLETGQPPQPVASGSVSLISFVAPSATPSLTPQPTDTTPPTPTLTLTATAPVCTRPGGWISYRVQTGDTLGGLAAATGTTMNAIMDANCLETTAVSSGQELWLPQLPATAASTATAVPPNTPEPPSPSPTPEPVPPTFTPPSQPTFTPPANPG